MLIKTKMHSLAVSLNLTYSTGNLTFGSCSNLKEWATATATYLEIVCFLAIIKKVLPLGSWRTATPETCSHWCP